jgi:hypothetical protein
MNIKEINKKIKAVAKTATTNQDNIQDILIACSEHGNQHKNNTPFTTLVVALPNGIARNKVIGFIETNTCLNWNNKEQRFNKPRKDNSEYNITKTSEKWFNFVTEKEVKPLDLNKELDFAKFIETAIKRKEKAIVEGRLIVGDPNAWLQRAKAQIEFVKNS